MDHSNFFVHNLPMLIPHGDIHNFLFTPRDPELWRETNPGDMTRVNHTKNDAYDFNLRSWGFQSI